MAVLGGILRKYFFGKARTKPRHAAFHAAAGADGSRSRRIFGRPGLFGAAGAWKATRRLVAALLIFHSSLQSAEITAPEYQAKAAFLYYFAKFIEWPADTFRDPGAPFVIGIFGKDPFGLDLEKVVGKGKANGRSVVIKRFNNVLEAKATQILFVPATEEARWTEIASAIKGLPVLTVGETAQFPLSGGVISLIPEGKMRVTINMDAASRARLVVSSHLQDYARIIRPSQPDPKK